GPEHDRAHGAIARDRGRRCGGIRGRLGTPADVRSAQSSSLMPAVKDRRRAQSGATLIELLVSLVIASLAIALVVGTLSSGLLDSTIAKRNTAAQAILQYEMEAISASNFDASAPPYSDCFATEDPSSP